MEELLLSASALLTFDVFTSAVHSQKSYIFGGDDIGNVFEMMIWLSQKSKDELLCCYRKKDMKNIVSEIIKRDEWRDILELFLMRGLDPNSKINRYPILFYSSINNMRLLLEYGADPNLQMKSGIDPLHFVLKKKDDATLYKARWLIMSGANVYRTYKGVSSHEKLREYYGEGIIDYVRMWMDQPALIIPPLSQNYELFQRMIKKEEENQIERNEYIAPIIEYAETHRIPLENYSFNRRSSIENYKYEIFMRCTANSMDLHDLFVQKRKYRGFV